MSRFPRRLPKNEGHNQEANDSTKSNEKGDETTLIDAPFSRDFELLANFVDRHHFFSKQPGEKTLNRRDQDYPMISTEILFVKRRTSTWLSVLIMVLIWLAGAIAASGQSPTVYCASDDGHRRTATLTLAVACAAEQKSTAPAFKGGPGATRKTTSGWTAVAAPISKSANAVTVVMTEIEIAVGIATGASPDRQS